MGKTRGDGLPHREDNLFVWHSGPAEDIAIRSECQGRARLMMYLGCLVPCYAHDIHDIQYVMPCHAAAQILCRHMYCSHQCIPSHPIAQPFGTSTPLPTSHINQVP